MDDKPMFPRRRQDPEPVVPPEILAFKAARDLAYKSKEDTEEIILGHKFEFEIFRHTGFVVTTRVTRLSDGLSVKMRTSDALLELWRMVEAKNPPRHAYRVGRQHE